MYASALTIAALPAVWLVNREDDGSVRPNVAAVGPAVGDVTESTSLENAPVGSRTAILLQQGTPAKGIFVFQMNDPASASCLAFFDDMSKLGPLGDSLQQITGTVQLAP